MTKLPLNVKPVLVEWIDSMSRSGWGLHKEPSNMNCVTIGHLIEKAKDRVVLSLSMSQYSPGEIIEIPSVAVKRIRKLKL